MCGDGRANGTPATKRWTLDDIPWDRFDPTKIDPDIVKVVKAASMVEANGGTYANYLAKVFHDDRSFQNAAWVPLP